MDQTIVCVEEVPVYPYDGHQSGDGGRGDGGSPFDEVGQGEPNTRAWSSGPPPQEPQWTGSYEQQGQWQGDPGYQDGGQWQQEPPRGWDYGGWEQGRERSGTSSSTIVVVVLVVLLLVVAAVIATVLFMRKSDSGSKQAGSDDMVTVTSYAQPGQGSDGQGSSASSRASSSTSASPTTRPSAPGGLVEECGDSGQQKLGRWGRGTTITSCPFAGSVRQAYLDGGHHGEDAYVSAYSSVTGQTYGMSCSGGQIVTCSGGNNAVVYIY